MPFETFPWFRRAAVESIVKVEQPLHHQFHWPDLDVDLTLDSIENPESYPLRSKVGLEGAGRED